MHEEGDEDVGETCRHPTFTAITTDTASDTTRLLHVARPKLHRLSRACHAMPASAFRLVKACD